MIAPRHLRQMHDVSHWHPPEGISVVITYKPASETVFVTMTTCCAANWVAITEPKVTIETFARLDREARITLEQRDEEHAANGCFLAAIREPFQLDVTTFGRDQ